MGTYRIRQEPRGCVLKGEVVEEEDEEGLDALHTEARYGVCTAEDLPFQRKDSRMPQDDVSAILRPQQSCCCAVSSTHLSFVLQQKKRAVLRQS